MRRRRRRERRRYSAAMRHTAVSSFPARAARALAALAFLPACTAMTSRRAGFAETATFLEERAGALLLESGTGAFVVSPQLQGRVMTSTVCRGGESLGFVNRAEIERPTPRAAFANFGGEDRFWIGPEGGPFAFYFAPGEDEVLANWRVPADLNEGPFRVRARGQRYVEMEREMALRNRIGQLFEVHVLRRVEAPQEAEVLRLAGGALPEGTEWVAFRSVNRVTNRGRYGWFRETGLPCVWILGMFQAAPRTWVVAPFHGAAPAAAGAAGAAAVVQTAYFGEVGPERLKVGSNFALFRADARKRTKIGLYAERAQPVLGAYDPDARVLTVVEFGPLDRTAPYVNELWDPGHPEPYHGDVANSYNHGGPERFFELESSSPALELRPGESYEHVHMTVHLRLRDDEALARVTRSMLGVDWSEVSALAGF